MKAKRNNDVSTKLAVIKDYAKSYSNTNPNHGSKYFKLVTENFRANIKDLMEELDEKIVLINSIQEGLDES